MRFTAVCIGLLLLTAAAFPQNPTELFDKAPPDVDEALRARITKFYQAHVDGKFRAADALVAEDSKDEFYGMEKQRCSGFAVGTITYSENFTKAKVMIVCDTQMMMMMMGRFPVKLPVTSLWRIEGGEWYWYLEPWETREIKTPFGTHKPGQQAQASKPAAPFSGLPGTFVTLDSVAKLVTADKQEVRFAPFQAGAERVVVSNGLPGVATLNVDLRETPGLTCQLDRTSLNGGEKATLSIRYEPVKDVLPSATVLKLHVSPTEQVITINVSFSSPQATARTQ